MTLGKPLPLVALAPSEDRGGDGPRGAQGLMYPQFRSCPLRGLVNTGILHAALPGSPLQTVPAVPCTLSVPTASPAACRSSWGQDRMPAAHSSGLALSWIINALGLTRGCAGEQHCQSEKPKKAPPFLFPASPVPQLVWGGRAPGRVQSTGRGS